MMLHCSGEGLPTGKCILSIIPPLYIVAFYNGVSVALHCSYPRCSDWSEL